MQSFIIKSKENITIRFIYDPGSAPVTCAASDAALPFSQTIYARAYFRCRIGQFGGQELIFERMI